MPFSRHCKAGFQKNIIENQVSNYINGVDAFNLDPLERVQRLKLTELPLC